MMGRLTRHAVALVSAVGAMTIVEAGCSHDDSTLFVRGVLAPPQATNATCAYSAESTNPLLSSGTLDVGLLATYQPVALFGNQMVTRQSNESSRTETSRISIQGVVVHVTSAESATTHIDRSFTALTSGFADPGTSDSPGLGVAAVTLIDPATTDLLRGALPVHGTLRLNVRFKVFGQTLGGQSLESNEYQFPVDVCKGCLVVFPEGSQDSAQPTPNCLAPVTGSSTGAQSYPAPCVLGQDQPVDCRLCRTYDVCDPSKI